MAGGAGGRGLADGEARPPPPWHEFREEAAHTCHGARSGLWSWGRRPRGPSRLGAEVKALPSPPPTSKPFLLSRPSQK